MEGKGPSRETSGGTPSPEWKFPGPEVRRRGGSKWNHLLVEFGPSLTLLRA